MMQHGGGRPLELFLIWAVVLVLILGLFKVLDDWLSLPMVEREAFTQRCIDVVGNNPKRYTCANLPERYATRTVYPDEWRMR